MAGQRKANSEREPIWRREEELVDLSKVPNRDMRCLPLYHGSGMGAIKVQKVFLVVQLKLLKEDGLLEV
jgi:hypothetical protein